jgi:O-acetyl-ADP-ribose deacetylase (regulator of RNase III)
MNTAAEGMSYVIGPRTLELRAGRIETFAGAGVLVSSDDNYLSHGGGVSAALWRAAGPELAAALAVERPRLRLGSVHTTTAGRLPARHLLHAVTIDLDEARRLGTHDAVALYGRVIDETARLGQTVVATPLLGAGAGTLSVASSAVALATAMQEREALPGVVIRVVLLVLEDDFRVVLRALDEHGLVPGDVSAALPVAPADGYIDTAQLQHVLVALVERGRTLVENAFEEGQLDRTHALDPTIGAFREGKFELAGSTVHRSPSTLLRLAEQLHSLAGAPVSRDLVAAVSDAIIARNALAHHSGEGGRGASLRDLSRGIHALSVELVTPRFTGAKAAQLAAASVAKGFHRDALVGMIALGSAVRAIHQARRSSETTSPEDLPTDVKADPPSSVAEPVQPVPEPAPPPKDVPSGTQHVRKLHGFLLQTLESEEIDELVQWLRETHRYKGDRDLCLLEHCVSVEDPIAFLADRFNSRRLRQELKKRTGEQLAVNVSTEEAASRLLEYFGYPVVRPVRGLESVRAQIANLHSMAKDANRDALVGGVVRAGSQLEYLVLVLLRFVCKVLHEQPAELYFRQLGQLEESRPLDKCGLGKLLSLLEILAKELEATSGGRVEVFRIDFGTDRLAPQGAQGIAMLRNRFAHFERGHVDLPLDAVRAAAGAFYDEAAAFLDHLGNPSGRVFPYLVTIEQVETDKWGRRVIRAINDEGEEERIFTDTPLRPGETYFMHPLTNPLRVDPILVPAGELKKPSR